jgi:hypothetical protein
VENEKSEVRIPKRKRGGQPGNSNRLRHGRYAAETLALRKHVSRVTRTARHVIVRAKMFLRVYEAVAAKRRREKSQSPARISVQALMISSLFFMRRWKMPDFSNASMSRVRPWRAKIASGSWMSAPSLAGSSPMFSMV